MARPMTSQPRFWPVQCTMSQVVEVSLKLPVRPQGKTPSFPNGIVDIRFIKRTELDTIPAVGEVVTMSAGAKLTFRCTVVQRSWHESKNLFVLACEYGGSRRISNEDYATILEASDWVAIPLL